MLSEYASEYSIRIAVRIAVRIGCNHFTINIATIRTWNRIKKQPKYVCSYILKCKIFETTAKKGSEWHETQWKWNWFWFWILIFFCCCWLSSEWHKTVRENPHPFVAGALTALQKRRRKKRITLAAKKEEEKMQYPRSKKHRSFTFSFSTLPIISKEGQD